MVEHFFLFHPLQLNWHFRNFVVQCLLTFPLGLLSLQLQSPLLFSVHLLQVLRRIEVDGIPVAFGSHNFLFFALGLEVVAAH